VLPVQNSAVYAELCVTLRGESACRIIKQGKDRIISVSLHSLHD